MSWLESLLHPSAWLGRVRPALWPLEKATLDAVGSRLRSEAQLIFQQQVARVNFVQRIGRESDLYCLRGGKPVHGSPPFPNQVSELRLATARIRVGGLSEMLDADCALVRGYLFSIIFSKEVDSLKREGGIAVESVTIHQDPMVPVAASTSSSASSGKKDGAKTLRSRESVPAPKEPPSQADRDRLLANIAAPLPEDYLETASGSSRVGDWEVVGLGEVYRVTLDEADFYVLARNDEQQKAIGAKAKEATPKLYLLDYGGLPPEPLGESFRAALDAGLASRK